MRFIAWNEIKTGFLLAFCLSGFGVISCAEENIVEKNHEIQFQSLYWPATLTVRTKTGDSVSWRLGIDLTGNGRVCGTDSEWYCMVLDNLWAFAIPRSIVENPEIGARWEFGDYSYLFEEIVEFSVGSRSCRTFVITTLTSNSELQVFHFQPNMGIIYATLWSRSSEFDESPDEYNLDLIPVQIWRNELGLALNECD